MHNKKEPQPKAIPDYLNFIVVHTSEDFFNFFARDDESKRIESINLRPKIETHSYRNGPEDKFIDLKDSNFYYSATVYHLENTGTFFLHVGYMGRLYFCTTLLEVAGALEHLLDHEAAKIIN